MSSSAPLPTLVIVGRPNVGKSTLFNALTGTRRSIVGDEPGITRDRIYGEATHGNKRFAVIDTGGIIPHDDQLIPSEIFRQARVALQEADAILFVIDGRTDITGVDRELAEQLRRLGKRVILTVNKIDAPSRESLINEFYGLRFEEVMPVSAEHRLGLLELLDEATKDFPDNIDPEEEAAKADRKEIRVAIIGRPNAGKSTLLNTLTGKDRAIVSPVAGTTRDAVDETLHEEDADFVFVDTAGIRRKGKTKEMAEKLSVVMARRHIRMSHVVVLVMDATEGVLGLDATIAGYAHEEGRCVVLCVNKWDIAPDRDKRKFVEQVRDELKFLEYAMVVFISAKTGAGVNQILPAVRKAYEAASKRVGTGELNRFAETLDFGPDMKVQYITQASIRPPTFVLFTNQRRPMHFSIERFVVNRLRERFGVEGTPVVIKTKIKGER